MLFELVAELRQKIRLLLRITVEAHPQATLRLEKIDMQVPQPGYGKMQGKVHLPVPFMASWCLVLFVVDEKKALVDKGKGQRQDLDIVMIQTKLADLVTLNGGNQSLGDLF
ncbi:MAG: hypothetical protein JZU63_03920, partial [Rhodoferax sp.]|nr:hypothetical protein [Rhodoferax sp.]